MGSKENKGLKINGLAKGNKGATRDRPGGAITLVLNALSSSLSLREPYLAK